MSSSTTASSSLSPLARLRLAGLSVADRLRWLAPLLARVVVGLVFLHSGWGKLHNLDKVTEYFRSLGIPSPELQAPFASAMEFGCGCLVLAGLFTRLASVPLIVIMVVALKSAVIPAHASDFADQPGALGYLNVLFGLPEFLYIALLVGLALGGGGALSLDRAFFGRAKSCE